MIEEIDMFELDIDEMRVLFKSVAGSIVMNYGFKPVKDDGYEKYVKDDIEIYIWPSFEVEVIREKKPIKDIEEVYENWKGLGIDIEEFLNDEDGFYFIGIIPTDEYMDEVIDAIIRDVVGYVEAER